MKSSLAEILLELKEQNIHIDLKNTDFLQIQEPIQIGNYIELGEVSYNWLQKGYYDFRLIIYFLYSSLLEKNNLLEILSVISQILDEHNEELGPKVYKERQFFQVLIWFHKRLLVYVEEHDLNTQTSIEEFESVISRYKKKIKEVCKISYCDNLNIIENKILLLANEINSKEEVQPAQQEEVKIFTKVESNNDKKFFSRKLEKLLNKISLFKKFLKQENYQMAANVEYIIDQELDKYKIDYYFEDLFIEYFSLKLDYSSNLKNYHNMIFENSGSKEIDILERLLDSSKYLTQELSEA